MATVHDHSPKVKGQARYWVFEGGTTKAGPCVREALRVPDVGPYWVKHNRVYVPRSKVLGDSGWRDNLVVTVGKDLLLNRLFGIPTVPNAIDVANGNMGVGNSSAAAVAGNTQLAGGSVFLKTFDATFPSRVAEVVTTQATYSTSQANFNWQECGLFNGPTNGTSTLFDRIAPIGAFNKTTAVSIVLQIKITQG